MAVLGSAVGYKRRKNRRYLFDCMRSMGVLFMLNGFESCHPHQKKALASAGAFCFRGCPWEKNTCSSRETVL